MSASRFNVYRDGKVHVVSDMCSTCIFRTGNVMYLEDGRRDQMVRDSIRKDTAIVCHSTLGTHESAICRGFYDRHADDVVCLRMAQAFDVIELDAPRKFGWMMTRGKCMKCGRKGPCFRGLCRRCWAKSSS